MEIDLQTIVGWMEQLDPDGTLVDPCNPSTAPVRALLDGLADSMQTFLRGQGYVSTENGWVKASGAL